MGIRVLREPTYETTDDERACVLMSAGQLLQMHGLLERADIETMNRLIGRKPWEPTDNGSLNRLMLWAGFHELEYTPMSYERALVDFGYWRAHTYGDDPNAPKIDVLRNTWDYWRPFGRQAVEVRQQFADRITVMPRHATPADLDHQLSEGRVAYMYVELLPDGGAIYGLVLRGNAADGYETYHPVKGALHQIAEELFPAGKTWMSVTWLPDGTQGNPILPHA